MDNQLIDELRTELHGLDARLVSLDRELQDQKRPWFKDMSSVVALLAFVFSLLTTTIAFRRDKIQDQHNLRAELRGIIEKLNELPARNVENFVKYKADDGVPQTLSGFLNQENSTLSRQASDIMTQLPGDQVSAADYIALAQSEQSNRDFGAAIANLEKASALSGNLDDRVGSLRMLANLRFITGNPQVGRDKYKEAAAIFSNTSGYDPNTIAYTDFMTEVNWAGSETLIGDIAEAERHLRNAQQIIDDLPPSSGKSVLQSQWNYARNQIESPQQKTAAFPSSIANPAALPSAPR